MKITQTEKEIFDVIDRCRFGSMREVDLNDQELISDLSLSPNRVRLINQIRNGITFIDILKFHEGEPVLMILKSDYYFAKVEQQITLTK